MIQHDLVTTYLVNLTFNHSNKRIPQTYRAIFCPRTFALISLCVWSSVAIYLFSSFTYFKSQLNITSLERPFLILCILSRFLPDTITCYYLISHFYRTYLTIFLVICLLAYYLSPHENVSSLSSRIYSVLFL